jgi:hypothetical protein
VQLLRLRYYQLRRDLGIWVFIIALLVFFVSQYISEVSEQYSYYVLAVIAVLFHNYHLQRKDLGFVTKYLINPNLQILLNYNLILCPVSFALISNGRWLPLITLHVLVSLSVFVKLKSSPVRFTFFTRLFPAYQFEWVAGIRRTLLLLIPLLLVAVILSPVKLFGLAAPLLINSIFISFYNEFEPLIMLNPENLRTEEFLSRKTYFTDKILIMTNLPLLIINSAFHPEVIWYNAGFLISFMILAHCTIYIKYASYEPKASMPFHFDFLLLYASIFIPFLLPVSFLILYYNKKKAITNISRFA